MSSSTLKKVVVFLIIFFIIINAYFIWENIKTPILCSKNTVMNIVAHQDDDLLFLNPDLIHDIDDGRCIRTIYVTAGNAGSDSSYWLTRENGSKTAYASMSKVKNVWVKNKVIIEDKEIPVVNLKNNSKISLIFFRLPDGNFKGTGYENYNYQSIEKLWKNKIVSISTVDSPVKYTRQSLVNALFELIKIYNPIEIKTQDFIGNFGDGDHSDHHAAAYFSFEAGKKYVKSLKILSYSGYSINSLPNNVSGEDYLTKRDIFLKYGKYDHQALKQNYLPWLTRQYKN